MGQVTVASLPYRVFHGVSLGLAARTEEEAVKGVQGRGGRDETTTESLLWALLWDPSGIV